MSTQPVIFKAVPGGGGGGGDSLGSEEPPDKDNRSARMHKKVH